MLLYFPSMHLELAGPMLPADVRFLDPGLAAQGHERLFRPEALPLEPQMAKSFVEESLRFGEQFKDTKEIGYFIAGRLENYFDQTSMALSAELRSRMKATTELIQSAQPAQPVSSAALAAKAKAQGLLLLAFSMEEHFLEVDSLMQGARSGQVELTERLGFTDDDLKELREFGLQGEAASQREPAPLAPSWRNILEAMLLLTDSRAYYTDDPQVLSDLEEQGAEPSDSTRCIQGSAWKILGLPKPNPGKPWLDLAVSIQLPRLEPE